MPTRPKPALLLLAVTVLFSASLAAQAIDTSRFERLLLPIALTPVASGGALWQSDLWLHHEGSVMGQLYPLGGCFGNACAPVNIGYIQPGETRFLAVGAVAETGSPVQYLYVEKSIVEDVQLQLHLRNDPVAHRRPETELPVVRERDFRTKRITLLNVRSGATARGSLRIFSARDDAPTDFVVRIISMTGAQPPREISIQTARAGRAYGVVVHPAMVELHDVLRSAVDDRLRVEIRAVDPTVRFWAFASVVDNTTQRVTLFTPF